MKKISSAIALLFLCQIAFAQINFEHSYSSVNTQLVNAGQAFYYVDNDTNTIRIYSTNHSLLKSVVVPTKVGYNVQGVYLVTDELFDTDNSAVEFCVVTYGGGTLGYEMLLMNWNGSVLKNFGNYFYAVAQYDGSEFKLILRHLSQNDRRADVYSLPGSYPNKIESPAGGSSFKSAYPNPSSSYIHLPYNLPEGTNGTMEIYNNSGQMVDRYDLGGSFDDILFSTVGLTPGQYIYTVKSGNSVNSARFMVQ